jgi:hypothetical protein
LTVLGCREFSCGTVYQLFEKLTSLLLSVGE